VWVRQQVSVSIFVVRVALLIQHATPMRRIVLSFVASLPPLYSSTLFHKRYEFPEKKKLLNIKPVLIFSTTSI
jgi:hypothetical protein